MTRRARRELPNGIYHVTSRGTNHCAIYLDDVDRKTFLTLLGSVVARHEWTCRAFCLMTNHVHLLLETPDANLSSGMHYLQSGYARMFNARHDRSGHVFQGRYGAVRMTSDRQLRAAAAYIARNPIEAGLCEEAEEWLPGDRRGGYA